MDPKSNLDAQLIEAARLGLGEAMGDALGLGTRMDALDSSGRSALMLAARAGHVECVEDLMCAGADHFNA